MQLAFYSSVYNIDFENHIVGVTLANQFYISKNPAVYQQFLGEQKVVDQIGTLKAGEFLKRAISYTIEQIPEGEVPDRFMIPKITQTNINLTFSMHVLWVIKDNSVFSLAMYGVLLPEQAIKSDTRHQMHSNSMGLYSNTTFTENEMILYDLYLDFFIHYAQLGDNIDNDSTVHDGIVVSAQNYMKYDKSTTRISRACIFLEKARATSFLPTKISFYIAMLECMFNTNAESIAHDISQKAAFYLGGDDETLFGYYKKFKICYDVRSKYFHGDVLSQTRANREILVDLSQFLDTSLRSIFIKLINGDRKFFDDDQLFVDLMSRTVLFKIKNENGVLVKESL